MKALNCWNDGPPTGLWLFCPLYTHPSPLRIESGEPKFIEFQRLFNNKQGGFRKGRSTISTVAMLTDDLLTWFDNMKYFTAAFIDLKKAFDTINHDTLIKKLPHFGMNVDIINWLSNYLTNRA